jgi:ribokinase
MFPRIIFAGCLRREYILPAAGPPILDRPGGSPLYAAGGAAVWIQDIGVLARVGEDYPRKWLHRFQDYGTDVTGVRVQPGALDIRAFRAYAEDRSFSEMNPVGHFARRGLPFPKALLGYQPNHDLSSDPDKIDQSVPRVTDIPAAYLEAEALHICPLNYHSQGRLLAAFKSGTVKTTSLDPSPLTMTSAQLPKIWVLLDGLTIFSPSEEELRNLFWGQTHDLWEMAVRLGEYGCEMVVIKRGKQGQWLYHKDSGKRWEIPAYSSRITDPTGAGDAFSGGFLAGYHATHDPVLAAAYGNASASLSMEGSGPSILLMYCPDWRRRVWKPCGI